MAAKRGSGKTGEAAWAAQGEKYLQRLLEDESLRSSLLGAYTAARSAYGRLGNGKGQAHALFEDPKLQQELIDAAAALRSASSALIEPAPPKPRARRRGRGLRRSTLLIVVGAAAALVLSSDLRAKVLDVLFGAEEEFDYTSTTAPASPAPASVAGG